MTITMTMMTTAMPMIIYDGKDDDDNDDDDGKDDDDDDDDDGETGRRLRTRGNRALLRGEKNCSDLIL